MFKISWRANEGYGDFITGLGYAHSSVIKYNMPVEITFHWPNSRSFKFGEHDVESNYERFCAILDYLKPVNDLTINHEFESIPEYRFINELEEFNPLHGLWYPKKEIAVEKGLVVVWTSKQNTYFPGYHKDPAYDQWDEILDGLKTDGYRYEIVTYQTPIKTVLDLISRCEFGIGYEGMIHQLFKFSWRPSIVFSQRTKLSELLTPQAITLGNPNHLIYNSPDIYVQQCKSLIKHLKKKHTEYVYDTQDPTKHKLFNIRQ